MTFDEIISRMHNQQLYFCDNEDIVKQQLACLDKQFRYNQLMPSQLKEKQTLLKEMFAQIGEGCYIEAPLHANWAGKNVHLGSHVYANFNLVLVDDCDIFIDDNVMIGPNVAICAGTHPVNPDLRRKQAQYNLPVHIENNVWIGANSVVMPGVTIKENSVIGAGSVVTKDIPANVVAVGNPCRVLREINDKDKLYYYQNKKIDIE